MGDERSAGCTGLHKAHSINFLGSPFLLQAANASSMRIVSTLTRRKFTGSVALTRRTRGHKGGGTKQDVVLVGGQGKSTLGL